MSHSPTVSPTVSPKRKVKHFVIVKEYAKRTSVSNKLTPKNFKHYLQKTILKEQLQIKDIKSERDSMSGGSGSFQFDDVQRLPIGLATEGDNDDEKKTFFIGTPGSTPSNSQFCTPSTSPSNSQVCSPCTSPQKVRVTLVTPPIEPVKAIVNDRQTDSIPSAVVNNSKRNWWDLRRIALVGALVVGGTIGAYHISHHNTST